MTTLPPPCPVRLGVVRTDGPEEQLHRYTIEKNLTRVERLLRNGRLLLTPPATHRLTQMSL